MKKAVMFSLLAGAAMAFTPISASAIGEMKKVVRDTNAHIVKNTFGNCVITKWDAVSNECGEENLAIYFAFDSAVLTGEAYAKLDQLIGMIGTDGATDVDIIGFADMIGASDYNYRLSQRRAAAVEQYLATHGVDTRNITVRGFGEDAPQSDCAGVRGAELKACLWRDRRVEIKVNH